VPQLPWDVAIIGTPISTQAKRVSRARWIQTVAAAARAVWPAGEAPLTGNLQITITCFHDSAPPLDADNMIKPIQDALTGIVYVDDRQITDTRGRLRDLNGEFRVRGLTPEEAKGFSSNQPFVHITIDLPPPPSELR
jgi:crossover junction endodeoxyribonuclease RusA